MRARIAAEPSDFVPCGLEVDDFHALLRTLTEKLQSELGSGGLAGEPTKASKMFDKWVKLAGARVRGHDSQKYTPKTPGPRASGVTTPKKYPQKSPCLR